MTFKVKPKCIQNRQGYIYLRCGDMYPKIRQLAKENKISMNELATQMIAHCLEELEDQSNDQ